VAILVFYTIANPNIGAGRVKVTLYIMFYATTMSPVYLMEIDKSYKNIICCFAHRKLEFRLELIKLK